MIVLIILLIISGCFLWKVFNYFHDLEIEALRRDMCAKINMQDVYIKQLLRELRSKQYEIDNIKGYKSC